MAHVDGAVRPDHGDQADDVLGRGREAERAVRLRDHRPPEVGDAHRFRVEHARAEQQPVVVQRDPLRVAVPHQVLEGPRGLDRAAVDVQSVLADRSLWRRRGVVGLVGRVGGVADDVARGVRQAAGVADLVGHREAVGDVPGGADGDAAPGATAAAERHRHQAVVDESRLVAVGGHLIRDGRERATQFGRHEPLDATPGSGASSTRACRHRGSRPGSAPGTA